MIVTEVFPLEVTLYFDPNKSGKNLPSPHCNDDRQLDALVVEVLIMTYIGEFIT